MMIHAYNGVVIIRIAETAMCLQTQRMKAIAEDQEWGVQSIKSRRNDEHGNIEFLVE